MGLSHIHACILLEFSKNHNFLSWGAHFLLLNEKQTQNFWHFIAVYYELMKVCNEL